MTGYQNYNCKDIYISYIQKLYRKKINILRTHLKLIGKRILHLWWMEYPKHKSRNFYIDDLFTSQPNLKISMEFHIYKTDINMVNSTLCSLLQIKRKEFMSLSLQWGRSYKFLLFSFFEHSCIIRSAQRISDILTVSLKSGRRYTQR